MRLPRVIAKWGGPYGGGPYAAGTRNVVMLDIRADEWEDPVMGLRLATELLIRGNTMSSWLMGHTPTSANLNRIAELVSEAFLPLLANGDVWFAYHTEKFCVREETISSMICLRELAKET